MDYVVVDLEATCWDRPGSIDQMEIIEIGAVKLQAVTLEFHGEFASFVRPVQQPVLSAFCTGLTSIRQQDVDQAEPFPVVFSRFLDWLGAEPFQFCSWGRYDLQQLGVDCRRHRLSLPVSFHNHLHLKKLFAERHGVRRCGMAQALRRLGLPLEGTHHRGLDDARNIARIATRLFQRD